MSGHNGHQFDHLKVLVVDDNVVNLKVTQAMLNHFNIQSQAVDSGELALHIIKNETFDMILMDCQMPVMSGFDTTRAIRAMEDDNNPTKNDVLIIATTANATKQDIEECYASGMNDFIAKPVELDLLNALFEKWYGSD